jgi:hypothetical protein
VVIPPLLGLAEWDVQIYNFSWYIFFHRIYTGDDFFRASNGHFLPGFLRLVGTIPPSHWGSVGKATGHWSDFLWVIFVLQEVDLPINSMVIFHSYVNV